MAVTLFVVSFGLCNTYCNDFIGLWATPIPKGLNNLFVTSGSLYMQIDVVCLLTFAVDFVYDGRLNKLLFDFVDIHSSEKRPLGISFYFSE